MLQVQLTWPSLVGFRFLTRLKFSISRSSSNICKGLLLTLQAEQQLLNILRQPLAATLIVKTQLQTAGCWQTRNFPVLLSHSHYFQHVLFEAAEIFFAAVGVEDCVQRFGRDLP